MIWKDPFLPPPSTHVHKFFLTKIAKNARYIISYHKSKGWSLIIKCISASRNLAEEINKKELLVLFCFVFFFQNNTQRKYDNTSGRQVRKGKFNRAEASHEQSVWQIHGFLYCLGTLSPSLLDQIKAKQLWTFSLASLFHCQRSPLKWQRFSGLHKSRGVYFQCHSFVSAHGTGGSGCCGGNNGKWQNSQGQICIKFCSSLDLGFAKTYCMCEKKGIFFFFLSYIFGNICRLWTFYMTQECKAGYFVQKGLSSTSDNFTKFVPTLFLLASQSFLEKQLLLHVETGILVAAPGSIQHTLLEV